MNVNSAKDESVIEVYMTPWKYSPVMVVVVDGIDGFDAASAVGVHTGFLKGCDL